MSKRKRIAEAIKNLLIVLLTCTALWLVVDSQLFGHLPGRTEPRDEYGDGDGDDINYTETVSGQLTLPLQMAVINQSGCYGVQYNSREVSDLFEQVLPVLGEALSGAEQVLPCTRAQWQQKLTEGPAFWLDLQGKVPLNVLTNWVSGTENSRLTADTTHLLLGVDGKQSVQLYYQDAADGQFYMCVVDMVDANDLRNSLEQVAPNGASFAVQDPELAAIQPQMLILPQTPQPGEYSSSNPLTAGDEQERLDALLEQLSFPVEITTVYDTPEGKRARAGNDTLTISGTGVVSYESTREEGRYPVDNNGEDSPEYCAVDGARQLVCGLLEPWSGSAGLYLNKVEQLSENSWRVEFRYELDNIPALVGSNGYAASVLVDQGYITQYEMQLRTFTPINNQTTLVLSLRQAAAIAASMDEENGVLQLCYQDNGDVYRAGWVVE